MTRFDNSYARLPDRFFSEITPEPATAPDIVLFNDRLAAELGLASWADRPDILSGNAIPDGASPLAQVYAGHQFGGWVPRLGDGRAVLLGEIVSEEKRFDVQLKGAGRTPYSRNGDGRAWIGPVLREYLVSEWMAAAGVPTTRALAAVTTGDRVQRERGYPGAVLTRVAASHIRVGTFQYFTAQGDTEALEHLAEHVRQRHYPEADTLLDLYGAIVAAQAELLAKWMSLGFVHGVMNTDNMAVSGETIDYGPCAFIDAYSAKAVYSSIDQFGRYAYDQQPSIAAWNLAQLGSCFVSLLEREDGGTEAAVEALTEVLNRFADIYQEAYRRHFTAKIGISEPRDGDIELVMRLLSIMDTQGADFTNTFRGLADGSARDWFVDRDAYDAWAKDHAARIADEPEAAALMARVNPAVIPRTHRLEEAIVAAVEGNYDKAHRLAAAFADPFNLGAQHADLVRPPSEDEIVPRTFCGT